MESKKSCKICNADSKNYEYCYPCFQNFVLSNKKADVTEWKVYGGDQYSDDISQ